MPTPAVLELWPRLFVASGRGRRPWNFIRIVSNGGDFQPTTFVLDSSETSLGSSSKDTARPSSRRPPASMPSSHQVKRRSFRPFQALLSAGITKAVTRALRALTTIADVAGIDVPLVDSMLACCLFYLTSAISAKRQYHHLPEAINAGLLAGIVAAGNRAGKEVVALYLQRLLGVILPGALTYSYRNVHSAVANHGVPTTDSTSDARFTNSPVHADWLAIVVPLEGRIATLNDFKSPAYVSTTPCDGPKCGLVKRSADIRCCSGCKLQYYCSLRCQLASWRSGHRLACETLPRRNREGDWMAAPVSEILTGQASHVGHFLKQRDDAFLRLILHREQQSRIVEILLKKLEFVHHSPATTFMTVFDYTQGTCTIRVESWLDLFGEGSIDTAPENLASGMYYIIVATHAESARNGFNIRVNRNVYVTKSKSSEVEDALEGIADRIPADNDVLARETLWPDLFVEL
ncbi:hypothetical protein C8R43DRAFT_1139416 [Mycena crocata]|nr:hypothetical protein C8R43DRAFT_1139416 [Mycena crocata]